MPAPGSSAASAETLTLATVVLGGLELGIPAQAVVRALPRPAALAQLPRSSRAIDGVFSDGGRVVPVVDLRRWMDGGQADGTPGHVMVLADGGRVVGLAVDAIRGLVRVPRSRISKVHHDDAEDAFFHSVATLDDGVSLLSVLDPQRLMEQVQAWTGDGSGTATGGGPQTQADARDTRQFALVRLGGALLGIPAQHVAEVVRNPSLQPLDLGESQVSGMVQWRGMQMPLLAGPRALGMDEATGDITLVLLLSEGARSVALPIDEVVAMRAIDRGTMQPSENAGLARNGFFEGVASTGGGENALLLDAGAVLDAYAVAGLSEGAAGREAAAGAQGETVAESHIVVRAGHELAVPIGAVHEIFAVPGDFRPVPSAADTVVGSCEWRGQVLPVLDIGGGAAAHPQSARLVVTQHGGRRAALLVEDLVALLPQHTGTRSRFTVAGSQAIDMITVGLPAARRSYRLLDVGTLPFFADAAAAAV